MIVLILQLAIKVERSALSLPGLRPPGRFTSYWGLGSVTAIFLMQRPPYCLENARLVLDVMKWITEHQPVHLSVLPQGSVVYKVLWCSWRMGYSMRCFCSLAQSIFQWHSQMKWNHNHCVQMKQIFAKWPAVKCNQSFPLMDWKSKPIRKLYDPNHSSVQTMREAIVFNVLHLFPETSPAAFKKVTIMPMQQNYKWPASKGAEIKMISSVLTLSKVKPQMMEKHGRSMFRQKIWRCGEKGTLIN